jgi:uncharacterized RDD family membrane protein YckC
MTGIVRLWQFGAVAALMLAVGLFGAFLLVFLPLVLLDLLLQALGGARWPLDQWLLPSAVVWVPLGVGFILRHLPPFPSEWKTARE